MPSPFEESLRRMGIEPTAPTGGRLLGQTEERQRKPEGVKGLLTSGLQIVDDIDKAGSDFLLKALSGTLSAIPGSPVSQFGIEDVEEKNWVLGAIVRGAASPFNFVPGLGIGRAALGVGGRTLARAAAIETAAGIGAEVAAQGVVRASDKLLPDSAPGALRATIGILGGTIGGSTLAKATGLKVPLQVERNLTSLAITNTDNPMLVRVAEFMDTYAPQVKAGEVAWNDDFIKAADEIIEIVEAAQPTRATKVMAAEMLRLNQTAIDIYKNNGINPGRIGGLNWLMGKINPAQTRERWMQDAFIQSEITVGTLSIRNVAEIVDLDKSLRDAFGVKDIKDIYDPKGRPIKGIRMSKKAQIDSKYEELVFDVRHILRELDTGFYDIDKPIYTVLKNLKTRMQEFSVVENAFGMEIKELDNYIPQRWIEPGPTSGPFGRFRSGGKATAEHHRKFQTLEQGIDARLNPENTFTGVLEPVTFSDLLRDRLQEGTMRIAMKQAEDIAVADIGQSMGLARNLKQRKKIQADIKKRRTATKSRIAQLKKNLQSEVQVMRTRHAKVKGKAQVAAQKAVGAQIREMGSLKARVKRAEGTIAGAERGRRAIAKIREGTLSDLGEAQLEINMLEHNLRDMFSNGKIAEAERVLSRVQEVDRRLGAGVKVTDKSLQKLLEKVDLGLKGMDGKAVRKAMEKADVQENFANEVNFFVKQMNIAAKTGKEFPANVQPKGFDAKRARDYFEDLRQNEDLLKKIDAEERLFKGEINHKVELEAEQRVKDVRAAFDNALQKDVFQKYVDDVASNIREAVLSVDFSAFTIQGVIRLFENPWQGFKDFSRGIQWLMSQRGFNDWVVHEADGLADASRSGLNVFRNSMEIDFGSVKPRPRTFVESLPGAGNVVRNLTESQFGRAIPMWKYQSWKSNVTTLSNLRTSKGIDRILWDALGLKKGFDPSELTINEIKRVAADHTNNAFGGLREGKIGRGNFMKTVERMFILTPDFLRATLGVAASTTKATPQGYLARTLIARMFAASAMAMTLSYYLEKEFNPQAPQPNLFDPSAPNWMFIKVGDRMLNPIGRFRTLYKSVLGPMVGATTGEEAAIGAWDSLKRYARGRTSVPLSIAVQQFSGEDYFGNPIQTKEGTAGGFQRLGDAITQLTPIAFQDLSDEGLSPGNVFWSMTGMSSFTLDPDEVNAMAALAKVAVQQGADPSAVQNEINKGRNPLYAADEEGRVILTLEQREAAIRQAAADSNIDLDTLHRMGREERILSVEDEAERQRTMRQTFWEIKDEIQNEYGQGLASIEAGVEETGDYSQFSRNLTTLRDRRRSNYNILFSDALPMAEVALDIQSRRIHDDNATDAFNEMIGAKLNDPSLRFIGPDGMEEIDFEKRDAIEINLRAQYGDAAIDAYFEHTNRKKTDLELERDHAFQQTLRPYFDLSQEIWDMLGGEQATGYATFQDFERGGEPSLVSRHPLTKQYAKLLRQTRDRLRLVDSEVEQAVVKWLGLQPIAYRRR